MEILIIGGSSFMGKNLIEQAPKNWVMRATYCQDKSFSDFAQRYGVEPLKIDLTENKIANLGKADVVVYFPTITPAQLKLNEDTSCLNRVYAVNAEGVNKVIDSMEKINRFVYISSGVIYVRNAAGNTLEYKKAKLGGEANVLGGQREGKFSSYAILRSMGAYGKYMANHKIQTRLMRACLSGEEGFKLDGDGTNLIDSVYIDDYVTGLKKVMESNLSEAIVDYCGGRPYNIMELASTITKVCERKDFKLNFHGQATENIKFHVNNDDFSKKFNFKPQISLEEGLRRWRECF